VYKLKEQKMKVIILGAGISGLSAGYHLKKVCIKVTLYEKKEEAGGLCRSKRYGNFIFDYGGHVSFTTDEYVKNLFAKSANDKYEKKQAVIFNYWKGYWIKHEPQNNLHSLPKEVIKKCLIDFIYSKYENRIEIKNYEDWCQKKFGKFFTENFTNKYTKKFWTVDSQKLTTDWIGTRLNQPKLEKIIDGALDISRSNDYYITTFRYPKEGGYEAFLKIFKDNLDIKLKTYPIEIDIERKEFHLNTGEVKKYETLISSIPLPELIKCIKYVPKDVLEATRCLKWTSLLMLNFYIKRKISTLSQWNYYYDEDIPYSRVFYMSKFTKNNSPDGCETLQVEIPYSKDKPIIVEKKELIDKVVQCIHKTENISYNEINYLGYMNIDYGYVIYDFNRKKSLGVIHKFLDDNGIYYCGRFGEWAYLWSDQALISGRKTAKNIIEGIK
jgi:protoporphyrinogen oxidase